MKIEIKLSKDELTLFRNLFQDVYTRNFQSVAFYNVMHSISLDLADTFDTKFKTLIKKANLFDAKKKIKFSFKYHEAWALKIYLNNELETTTGEWDRNALLKHIHNLDQQLQ
jgi:hypothetical protein